MLRTALGILRSFRVEGTRYKEVTNEPLRVALSRRGSGHKDYDVTFAGGGRLRIRITPQRSFADLVPPPTLPVCLRAERLLRPGMRVLVLPCGTGFAAAMVSGRVAPSGGVVALDEDDESIEFARLRYPIQNVSFERGGLADLVGETDGAFDAVIAIESHSGLPAESKTSEFWRLVAPEGWLLVATPVALKSEETQEQRRSSGEALVEHLGRLCAAPEPEGTDAPSNAHIGLMGEGGDGWLVAIARREGRSDRAT